METDIDKEHADHAQQQAADTRHLHGTRQVEPLPQVGNLRRLHRRRVLHVLFLQGAHQLGIGQETVGIGQHNQRYGRKQQGGGGNVIQESVHRFPGKFTESLRLEAPSTWTYKGIHNVFSCATDTVYAVTKDSIYPRYYIPEGKHKREILDCATNVTKDFYENAIRMGTFIETKEHLLFSFCLGPNIWDCHYNKSDSNISLWKYTRDDFKAKKGQFSGLINDIDGCSYSKPFLSYIDDRDIVIYITPDNADEIKKIVTESTNVKFPEKRQQLLELIDSMGPDDNPILAIYKLKD